jgi:hypothetical protein
VPIELFIKDEKSPPWRTYSNRSYIRDDKFYEHSCIQIHYHVDDKLRQWVNENIIDDYNDVGFRQVQVNANPGCITPHTDETREYALIYNFQTGGGDLVFYKEPGYPLYREGRVIGNNYDAYKEIERVKIPEHRWYFLNTRVIHSVENIFQDRLQIQISINYIPYNILLQ